PPPIEDTSTEGTIFLAFEAFRIDDIETADASLPPPRGLDLDDRCTCPEPDSCLRPGAGSADQKRACDPDGGLDNVSASTFGLLSTFGFEPDFATESIREGS